MKNQIYSFSPVKIHRIEGTSLAISLEVNETEQGDSIIRFYEVSDDEQTYKRIGFRIVSIPLYIYIKAHREAISDLINKFVDIHPQYEHLLKH